MLQENDIYLVRRKADNTFEELGESPFQYTGAAGDAFSTREFSIKTKLRVPELLVEGTHTILDTDTQTSEQLLITNDGTGPAVVINQKGQEAILDVQDDDASVLYIRGDNPHGGNVGIGMGRGPIVSSGSFVEGKTYTIASVNDGAGGGDTNFTVFGSPSNAIGEVFVAGPGAQGGTGTANLTILPAEQLELTKNMLLANDTSIFFRQTGDLYGVAESASISYTDEERLVISNPEGEGVELTATTDANVQMKIGTAGGVTLGKVNPEYENSGSHVEVSGDAKVNLMLTHRNESISGKLDINGTTNTLDIGTTTAHDLTLGTRNVAFFTLDQYGHAFLKQANPGSGLTGGDLTIDGKLSLGGDMLSIAGEEVLYSDYIHVTDEPKEYKILEFTYPTEIDDDNEATGDEGSAFIIEVWSDYQNAGEYIKYSLCHTFLDIANDGSTAGGDLDDPGSRDYALKILESHSVPNSGSFRIRLPKAGDGDIGDSDKNTSTSFDIASLPVFLDLKNYAGVRVKITSLSSGTKRIATDVNWSNSDEYRFWSAPTGVTIADWNANTPNTEPGDALFADTFYGSRNVNWLGTESGYSPYYLKPADTGTSMVVAGKVGIGTSSPANTLEVRSAASNTEASLLLAEGDGDTGGIRLSALDSSTYRVSIDQSDLGLVFNNTTGPGSDRPYSFLNGNVGIGTTTPDGTLNVEGSSSDTSWTNLSGLAGTAPSVLITNTANTANTFSVMQMIATEASMNQSFSIINQATAAGTGDHGTYSPKVHFAQRTGANLWEAALTINEDGNVGIGTNDPDKKLEIFNGGLKFGTNTAGLNEFELFPTDEGSKGLAVYDRTNTTYRMLISNDGNVGIGTTSPGGPLHVNKSGNEIIPLLTLSNYDHTGSSVSHGAALDFGLARDSGSQKSDAGRIYVGKDEIWTNDDTKINSFMSFNVYTHHVLSEKMRINSEGNVGIGTDSPSGKLHVSTGSDSNEGNIEFFIGGTNSGNARSGKIIKNTSSPYEMTIRAGNFTTGSDYQSLILNDTGGNVGIGTSSPLAKLQVESTNSTTYSSSHMPTISNVTGCFINAYSGGIAEGTHAGLQLNVVGNKDGSIDTTLPNVDNQNVLGYVGIVAEEDMTNAGALVFHSSPGGSSSRAESMRITSTGNVEIHTGNLYVAGSIDAQGYQDASNTPDSFELVYSSPTKKEYSKVITFDQPAGGTYGFNLAFGPGNLLGFHYKLTITSGRYDAGDGSMTVNQGTVTDEAYLYFEDDGEQDNNGTKTFREPLMEASIGGLHLVSVADYGATNEGDLALSAPYNHAVVRYNIDLPASAIKLHNGAPKGKLSLHLEVFNGVGQFANHQAPKFLSTNTP